MSGCDRSEERECEDLEEVGVLHVWPRDGYECQPSRYRLAMFGLLGIFGESHFDRFGKRGKGYSQEICAFLRFV